MTKGLTMKLSILLLPSLLFFATPSWGGGLNMSWDFENGKGDWSPWGVNSGELSDAQESQIVSISSQNPRRGSCCLEVKDSFQNLNPYLSLGKAIDIDPSKAYSFCGWIRTSDKLPRVAYAGLAAERDGKFVDWIANTEIQLTGEWQEFRVSTAKIPKEAKQLRPSVFVFGDKEPKSSMGVVFLDDLRFVEQSFETTDISKAANRPFKDDPSSGRPGWTSQGDNDFRGMKPGDVKFSGVPFKILDPASNGGAGAIVLSSRDGFDKAASFSLQESKPCEWLYLLHSAAWAKSGIKAGTAVLKYADGSSAELPIGSGEQVGDWWNGSASAAFAASLENVCPRKDPVYLFVAALKNPNPEKPVAGVEFKSSSDESLIWMILAASFGSGGNAVESSIAASRDYSKWFPFEIKNRKTSNAAVDLSFLLDAPAGKHGFLKAKDGHFVFEDGTPARFWGTNIHSGVTIFPTKEQAEAVADTLARYGVNLARIHLTEYVLIDHSFPDKEHFITDAEKLDRFDYFYKCMKDKGIYLLIDSVSGLSARGFTSADRVANGDQYNSHRPWAYYDPVLKEIGRNYMKDYLTHVNKYTGKALVDEPGVAMMMVINEQSAFFDWGGKKDSKAVPPYYQKLLAKLFGEWLLKTYGSKEALAKAWTSENGVCALLPSDDLDAPSVTPVKCDDLGTRDASWTTVNSPARIKDMLRFLYDLQTDFYKDTKAYLVSLGVKVPIAGTNIIYDVPELKTHLAMDYSSQNEYYDHVKYGAKENVLMMANVPLAKANPLKTRLIEESVAGVKVDSMPCTSTETDVMWPHEWRASHMLSVAAVSALQDWDAVFQYAYMGGWGYDWSVAENTKTILNPTVEFNDPAVMGTFAASALVRRDVAASKNVVKVVYNEKDMLSYSGSLKDGSFPFNYLTYVSRVEGSFDAKSAASASAAVSSGPVPGAKAFEYIKGEGAKGREALAKELDSFLKSSGVVGAQAGLQDGAIVSDTGEIVRDWKNGVIAIDTPRSQGLTGFPGKAPRKFKDLEISTTNLFATIMASSLDRKPLASSSKVFLTTVGRAENDKDKIIYGAIAKDPSGARGERMTLEKGKGGKVVVETVNAEIKLKASSARLTPLAPDMSAAAPAKEFKAVDGTVTVVAGEGVPSIWYLLEIER